MATAQTERSNPNGANYFDDNQDTLRMVKLLKEKILVENQQGATISQALIEYEFGCIKQPRRAFADDHDRSEKNSGQTLETSESRKQKRRAAYGNTSNELENIYKIIDEQEDEADRNPRKNNLKNILTPLQHFQTERFNCTAKHLCDALLQIPQSEIDRADRMFYSEISHRPNLNCCPTSEIVHDQVQAIRLMSFGTDQWDELETLFCKHQTFDDAYSYLQQLTQKRFEQRSLSNDSSRHCSIVRQSTSTNSNKNANVDANRQTPVNNGPRHNESRPGQAVRADSSTS